jgi:hypothetical protein
MESEILRRMGARWTLFSNVEFFCHDKDNHAMKIIREELHWDLIELFDKNHVMKTWKARFLKYAWVTHGATCPSQGPKRQKVLNDLESHLLRWFHVVLRTDETLSGRQKLWCGAHDHDIEPRETDFQWKLWDDETARAQLRAFFTNTIDLIGLVQSKFSTQLNESLHAMKAKLADKNYGWKRSWEARCAAAVLNMNEGHEWKLRLYGELGFPPLCPECRSTIEKCSAEARQHSDSRSEAEYQEGTKKKRALAKAGHTQTFAKAKRNQSVLHG